MALGITKTDVKAMVKVLNDEDYDTAEAAALAALDFAFDLYDKKGKFTVVGQMSYDGGPIDPEDSKASKLALGRYGTEIQALSDARKLTFSAVSGQSYRAWVLPIWLGTPAAWHKHKNEERKAKNIDDSVAERLSHRLAWNTQHPDLPTTDYPGYPKKVYTCDACGRPILNDLSEEF